MKSIRVGLLIVSWTNKTSSLGDVVWMSVSPPAGSQRWKKAKIKVLHVVTAYVDVVGEGNTTWMATYGWDGQTGLLNSTPFSSTSQAEKNSGDRSTDLTEGATDQGEGRNGLLPGDCPLALTWDLTASFPAVTFMLNRTRLTTSCWPLNGWPIHTLRSQTRHQWIESTAHIP